MSTSTPLCATHDPGINETEAANRGENAGLLSEEKGSECSRQREEMPQRCFRKERECIQPESRMSGCMERNRRRRGHCWRQMRGKKTRKEHEEPKTAPNSIQWHCKWGNLHLLRCHCQSLEVSGRKPGLECPVTSQTDNAAQKVPENAFTF